LNPRLRSRQVLNHPTRSDRGMSLSGTRNHIDCGAAGQLCNQRPPQARRQGSPCTSMPASQRLLSEDNDTRSIDVPLSVPGTKPVSRSAQKPAGNLSQSLRETARDEHEKSNQIHDAGRPHGIMPGRPQALR
jgi:hypothetical protein